MVGWLLMIGLSQGQEASPLYGYRFGHFENIADPQRSAENVRRHLELARQQGVPLEAYLHRGEHQAAWYAEHAPDVLTALRDPSITLSYHPHGVRPFTDLVNDLKSLTWDEAVAGFERLETCAIDYTTSAVDCTQKGGAAAVVEILGRPLSAVAYAGVDAVATYVHTQRLGIPVRGDSKKPMGTFSGPPVDLYWHMNTLVISLQDDAKLEGYVDRDQVIALRSLTGPGARLFGMLATDKVERHDINALIDERYQPGISTFSAVRPADSELNATRKIDRYWSRQTSALSDADSLLVRPTGGTWVTSATVIDMVHPPAEILTTADLDVGTAAVASGLGGLEVALSDRQISYADLYAGLRDALVAWRVDGALPESVSVAGILGPIGEPLTGPWPTGGAAARQPVAVEVLIDALAAAPSDRVAYTLPVGEGQDPLTPVEQLIAMASAWRALHAATPLSHIPRLDTAPWPIPSGVRGGNRTNLSRWDWYTRLQFWTTKRARWL
ncbi:MAG: hypothetical protein ACI8RZ_001785 [Myxococcota bacterium]|jgi:hypothetical protein